MTENDEPRGQAPGAAARQTSRSETVASVLTEAFTGDPVMAWIFPDPTTHVADLQTWWSFIAAHLPEGAQQWISDDASTSALWHAPDFTPSGAPSTADDAAAATAAREEFGAMVAGLVGDRLPIVVEFFKRVGNGHPQEPHWYLAAVGTRPVAQGQGSGAATLAPVLATCDREGIPAYLESSNPRNLAFYHRLGFVVTGEIPTPDNAAVLTAMWRTPQPGMAPNR